MRYAEQLFIESSHGHRLGRAVLEKLQQNAHVKEAHAQASNLQRESKSRTAKWSNCTVRI
jgi:hypothetical protein